MSRIDYFNSATRGKMPDSLNSKWQRYPRDVIPLWLASPDFRIAPEIKEALHRAVDAEDLYYNSDTAAREAMASKIGRVNGIKVTADDVMIGQGVDALIWLAVKHLCEPSDEVILTDPMYGPFINVMEQLGIKPIYWILNEEDKYRFDEERLKEAISPKTKLICVCDPHNPTGRVMTKEELKAIADIAVDLRVEVFVDELWEDIRFDGREHISLASLSPEIEELTATAWGVSKTFGVAGMYLGYLCSTNTSILDGFKKASRTIHRGSSTLSRAAAPVMIDGTLDWYIKEMMQHLHMIRGICVKRFSEINGVTFPSLEGTYVPFQRFDFGMSSLDLHEYLLREAKVALSPGINFGSRGEGHMRMCIATSETIINEAINRMENALKKLS